MIKREITVIMCFTCNLYPGKPGWRGYFTKKDGQWYHVDCPKKTNTEA
jgi:hypothetical protein